MAENKLEKSMWKLNCSKGSLSFTYIGIPIGVNPKKSSTWMPMMEKVEKRLRTWEHNFLSVGGMVTLINTVLSTIPIYFLSFYKAPSYFIRNPTIIQIYFLWGG